MAAHQVAEQARTTRGTPAWFRRVWDWWRHLPPVVTLIVWIVLAIVFAGTNLLLFVVPVVIGLWLWDGIRKVRPARTDLLPWIRHLAQMLVAMYAGMAAYMLICVRVIGVGASDLRYAGMIVAMVIPMVALMRCQHHSRRMATEMSLSMAVPMLLCLALVRMGICAAIPFLRWLTAANVYAVAHDAMLLGMLALMVYRRGMYATVATVSHGSGLRDADALTEEEFIAKQREPLGRM